MNTIAAAALAVLLVVNGVVHFVRPAFVQSMVPSWVPDPRLVVAAGGVALFLDAALLLTPWGRAAGAWTAAAMISVFAVAHVRRGSELKLLINIAYVAWAVTVAATAR